MLELQRVIDEAKPMLEEFLCDIGLHCAGNPLDFSSLLEPFSQWVNVQEITENDRNYFASRLGAFICQYLIDVRAAQRIVAGDRIVLRVPIQEGVLREFDPYAVAFGMARNRTNLKAFLDALSS